MKQLHLILLVLMNCCWAASYSFYKALLPYLGQGDIVTLRYGLVAIILLMSWPWLPGAAPTGFRLIRAAFMGVMAFTLSPRLQVLGVQMGSAADASVIAALDPLILSVGAAIFLREHIGARQWFGFVLGIIGVVLMAEIWRPDFHWASLASNTLIVLSFFCDSTSSIIGKPMVKSAGVFKVLGVAIVAGTAANLLIDGRSTASAVTALPMQAWLFLAFLSIACTLTGYSVWFAIIRETKINDAALTVFIQPIIGTAIAFSWLREPLHWGQLWGSATIATGLMIGLSGQISPRISNVPSDTTGPDARNINSVTNG